MIQSYKQYPDQSIWFGENYFTFGGNQTLEIKAMIDGEEFTDAIPLEVEAPSIMPVWLAWTLSSAWVFMLFAVPPLRANGGHEHANRDQRCDGFHWLEADGAIVALARRRGLGSKS